MATPCYLARPSSLSLLLNPIPEIWHDPPVLYNTIVLPTFSLFSCPSSFSTPMPPLFYPSFSSFLPFYQPWLLKAILLTPWAFLLSKPMGDVGPLLSFESKWGRSLKRWHKGIHSAKSLPTRLQCSPYWHQILFFAWRFSWWGRKTDKTKAPQG